MNFAESHYCRINRILLICLGLWPYYTQRMKYVYCIFLFLFLLCNVFFQLSAFITKEYSVDLLLNIFSVIGPIIYYTFLYFAILINENKIRELIEKMQYDWNSLKEEQELKIIHNYANIGRFYSIIVLITIYTTYFLFVLIFFSPNILDIVMPLNESRQSLWHLSYAMDFFIDRNKYVGLLTWYLILISFVGITTMITAETFMLMNVQHICAMFQITSYRIERTINKSQIKSLVSSGKYNCHKNIIEAIDSHRNAIKFVDSLKSTFSVTNFLAIPIGVGSLSINLYRLCEHVMARDISGTTIMFLQVFLHFGYMFLCNYIGQEIIDHSDNVFKKISNTRWYATPLNIQKCLVMIIRRSIKTSTLIVHLSLFIPSLEGYATLVSSSLSYFTVIYSMRR